ncbi:MAG: carboxylating nicotinate-nucleotide diphosphorylase [Planctomycetes bacterium]|nr:carboxylating nicotinate-nucleotide diphosphorylase [Planctomycetota bacterium]
MTTERGRAPNAGALRRAVEVALAEDLGCLPGAGDLTGAACVDAARRATGRFVARSGGVLCGLPVAVEVFRRLDPSVRFDALARDGERVAAGSAFARVSGPGRALLAGERTALNFLQRLSGVATLTARFVEAVAGTGARVLHTRKTTPGMRALERYAVEVGGGDLHRAGLHDAVLIKDNHLRLLGGDVAAALARGRAFAPEGSLLGVEVEDLAQFRAALDAGPDLVLLDNMGLEDMEACVQMAAGRDPRPLLEASGGVDLARVAAVARTGVDRISVGALTHSAPALDLALDLDPGPEG